MAADDEVLSWMLDSDPALRWQVERDLAGAPPEVWQATRARVVTEGFGARLLAEQDADGLWAGGAYFPAEGSPPEIADSGDGGQPYTATTWSLNALREWGADPRALDGTAEKLAAGARWEYDDLPYWEGEVDACINAFTLANGVWLGAEVTVLRQWFLDHRMAEGGWNCDWVEGSTRASVHSTLNAVRGLLSYEEAVGGDEELRAARHDGEEYLLRRRLRRRLSTGEPIYPWVDHLAYPFRWFYSALGAVDHFRAASLFDGTPPDGRLAEAVEVIRAERTADGRWIQGRRHPGAVWFEIDVPAGEPSKWLTFFATRAIDWWDAAAA